MLTNRQLDFDWNLHLSHRLGETQTKAGQASEDNSEEARYDLFLTPGDYDGKGTRLLDISQGFHILPLTGLPIG